jgi:hypothetical protein
LKAVELRAVVERRLYVHASEDQHCVEVTAEPMLNAVIESKMAVKATVRDQGSVE